MLHLADLDIDAESVGGLRTCIQLPQLDVAFDLGVCPPRAVHRPTVLFTHAHIDHMGAVVQHCATRELLGLAPPTYAVPPENAEALGELLAVWRRLDGSALRCKIVPLSPGEALRVRKGIVARPFRTIHRVVSQGYVLYEQRRKLLPAWQGRDGPEIAAARQQGIAVAEEVEVPLVAFTGDTRIEGLDACPDARRARLLIMEVTFYSDDVPVRKARAQGHIHVEELAEQADRFENEALLITHRSTRHSHAEALARLEALLPPALLARITLLPDPTA